MLRKVDRKYLDDAVFLMKSYVQDDNANKTTTEDAATGEITFLLPCSIEVYTYVVLDNGTPKRDDHGKVIIDSDRFIASGNMLHFIAFCLQEGELKPTLDLFGNEDWRYDKYYGDTPNLVDEDLHFDDFTEWREYIKNKYHIFPPKFDNEGFGELIGGDLQITGGLVFCGDTEECPAP